MESYIESEIATNIAITAERDAEKNELARRMATKAKQNEV